MFESGAARPGADTLSTLGSALNVPTAFFVRPLTETHEGFFRSLRRTGVTDRRRARATAYVAHDLALHAAAAGRFPASAVPSIQVSGLEAGGDEIEHIAGRVRTALGILSGPVPDVVQLLEDHGVVVIRLPLGTADVDAFSLPFPDHPVVVLGADKNDRARSRFDAAHELGHLVMHGEHIWGMPEVEKQAHMFAAAFLMPAHEIHPQLPQTVDWSRFFDLKRHWQVSLAALLRRAKDLGRMPEAAYLTAIKTASARGWRRLEPVPLGRPEQPRRLLAYIGTPAGRKAQMELPRNIIAAVADATTVA